MTKAVFVTFICLGVYFVILGVVALIKKIMAKRKFKKDIEKQKEGVIESEDKK